MDLKDAWKKVSGDDLDRHLLSIGQAQANASLVEEMMTSHSLDSGRLLIAGAGTGQLFDLVSPGLFRSLDLICTDINPEFVDTLSKRGSKVQCRSFSAVLDDLCSSKLTGSTDAALLVLVLEHLDWKLALEKLSALGCKQIYLILQAPVKAASSEENFVTLDYEPPQSILRFSREAKSKNLDFRELREHLERHDYQLAFQGSKECPGNKLMQSFVYIRQQTT